MRTAFETEGDLRGVDLLAAFVSLWRENESGTLRASRGGGFCVFEVLSGELVGVSSSDPRFETSAILVRAGKLDAGALERLSVPEGADRSLAALQAGIITKREWRWGEKIRAIEVLADLLTWIDGEYSFDTSGPPAGAEFRLAIPRLILELFLRSRDRNLIEHQLGPADAPLVRGENFDREFSTFGLTADAESVVQLIDGRATAAEISGKAPADDFAVQKLLAALVTLGLVRPEYASEEPARTVAMPLPLEDSEGPPEDFEPRGWSAPPPAGLAGGERPFDELPRVGDPGDSIPDVMEADESGPREPEPDWHTLTPERVERLEPVDRVWESHNSEPPSDEPGWEGPEIGSAPEPLDRTLQHPVDVAEAASRRSSGVWVLWLLGLVIAAGAVVFYLRSRRAEPVPAPPAAVAVPTPVLPLLEPTAAPTAAAGIAAETTVPAAAVASRPTAASAAAPRPTAPASQQTAMARVPQPSPAPARADARGPWVDRARRHERRLAGEPRTRYAIQLELACEVPTLEEAWKHDRPGGTMWLLPVDHRGRDCFRVLWGRYPSIEAAKAAKSRIPSFFVTGTNKPAVVGVR